MRRMDETNQRVWCRLQRVSGPSLSCQEPALERSQEEEVSIDSDYDHHLLMTTTAWVIANTFSTETTISVLIYVMANESTPIDLKALTKTLGFSSSNPLRFAPFEILPDTLNVEKGSLTPLAFYLLALDKAELNDHEAKVQETMNNIQIFIDHNLFTEESKNKQYAFHPLKNTSTTLVARQDFLKFLKRALGEKLYQQATLFNFEKQEKMVLE